MGSNLATIRKEIFETIDPLNAEGPTMPAARKFRRSITTSVSSVTIQTGPSGDVTKDEDKMIYNAYFDAIIDKLQKAGTDQTLLGIKVDTAMQLKVLALGFGTLSTLLGRSLLELMEGAMTADREAFAEANEL